MKDSNSKPRRSSTHTCIPLNSMLFSIPNDTHRSLGTSRILDSDLFRMGNSYPSSPVSSQSTSSLAESTIGIIDMALDIVGEVEVNRKTQFPQPKTTRTKQQSLQQWLYSFLSFSSLLSFATYAIWMTDAMMGIWLLSRFFSMIEFHNNNEGRRTECEYDNTKTRPTRDKNIPLTGHAQPTSLAPPTKVLAGTASHKFICKPTKWICYTSSTTVITAIKQYLLLHYQKRKNQHDSSYASRTYYYQDTKAIGIIFIHHSFLSLVAIDSAAPKSDFSSASPHTKSSCQSLM